MEKTEMPSRLASLEKPIQSLRKNRNLGDWEISDSGIKVSSYAKGKVYKRGRVWHVDYFANGKRVRESAKTTNKTVAERLLAQKLDEIDAGTYIHIKKAKDTGFSDFATRYLDAYAQPSPVWRRNKECAFKPLKKFFGNQPLS